MNKTASVNDSSTTTIDSVNDSSTLTYYSNVN